MQDGQDDRLVTVALPGGLRFARTVDWNAEDPDRYRVIALALVELLVEADREESELLIATLGRERAAYAELVAERQALRESRDQLEAGFRDERAAREDQELRERQLEAWSASASAAMTTYPNSGVMLYGSAVGGAVSLAGPLRLALDVSLGWGGKGDPLGSIDVFGVRVIAGLELRLRRAPLGAFAVLWGSTGWTEATGKANDPMTVVEGSVDQATGAVGLGVGGSVEFAAAWAVTFRLDLGYGFGGVDAAVDERLVAETHGLLMALRLGLAYGG